MFLVAALAATEGRAVATVDFPGAFLHAELRDDDGRPPVLVRLNKFETRVLVRVDKSFEKFVGKDGRCVVKLNRALYGCVESARLWYEKLSKELMEMGFTKNRVEQCVFNRMEADGSQTSLVIHVDDVMISAKSEGHIDKFVSDLKKKYKELTVQRGSVLEYLGMVFDFKTQGKVKITMSGYLKDFLEFVDLIEGTARTPAGEDLFKIDESSEKLDKQKREFFHSVTTKTLYLGKCVRPGFLNCSGPKYYKTAANLLSRILHTYSHDS